MKHSNARLIGSTLALLQLIGITTANIDDGHSAMVCYDGIGNVRARATKGEILGAITGSMKPGVGPQDSDCHPDGSYKTITSNGRYYSDITVSGFVQISAWANPATKELYLCKAHYDGPETTVTCYI